MAKKGNRVPRRRGMAVAAVLLAMAGAGVAHANAPLVLSGQEIAEVEDDTALDTLMTMTLIDGEIIHFFTDAYPCAVADVNSAAGLLVPVEIESGKWTFAVGISCICVTEDEPQ